MQKFKKTGGLSQTSQNELDKVCSQHDMAYRYFKDLPRRTGVDKVLHDIKHLVLLKIQITMDIKEVLPHGFINFSIKSHLL